MPSTSIGHTFVKLHNGYGRKLKIFLDGFGESLERFPKLPLIRSKQDSRDLGRLLNPCGRKSRKAQKELPNKLPKLPKKFGHGFAHGSDHPN